jgi:hypothetical protein
VPICFNSECHHTQKNDFSLRITVLFNMMTSCSRSANKRLSSFFISVSLFSLFPQIISIMMTTNIIAATESFGQFHDVVM